MKTVYKCEKCGRIFDDSEKAYEHESLHFTPKTWWDENDMKIVNRDTEWDAKKYAPTAVVIPLERTVYCDGTWKTETSYVKYYYSKQEAEEVFPIDESIIG